MGSLKDVPWTLISAAIALLLVPAGGAMVLLNAQHQYGWAYNLGVVLFIVPLMYLALLWFIRAFDKPNS